MTRTIDARTLKRWLSDEREIAVLDVREHGEYGERHLFFAVPLPYSRFELELPRLVPNTQVRLVLYDDGNGVAERAAQRAEAAGYENVHVLDGGASAWEEAGYTLYAGVNVPSKTFGELVEHDLDTPRISAAGVQALKDEGANMVIVDGRPFAEYRKMNIPGGICCPNGELALRIADIAPDPETQIIVNCAGRTRSIIGAQTLIDLGIPNKVHALENGTQGWFLAGLQLGQGASQRYPEQLEKANLKALLARTRALAEARGASFVTPEQLTDWLGDSARTTYVLDVRTEEEFTKDGVPGSVHAPGGQLIQATDQWVGVRHARLVLVDGEGVRAPMVASWLAQLGHEACVLEGGVAALAGVTLPSCAPAQGLPRLKSVTPNDLAGMLTDGAVQLIDVRPSMAYRAGHIAQAVWSIRSNLSAAPSGDSGAIVLVAEEEGVAALAARELEEAGADIAGLLEGGPQEWRAAGLEVAETPGEPGDAECIDFLFFTHERHKGNEDAARQYLAWEVGLVGQLDEQERGAFRITRAPEA